MANKRFEAKKVGDQYVLVPKGEGQQCARCGLTAGGALVALLGLRRGGLLGLVMTTAGAELMFHGIMGYSPVSRLFQEPRGGKHGDSTLAPSHHHDWKSTEQLPADEVDEAAMESFPASDPPSSKMQAVGPAA